MALRGRKRITVLGRLITPEPNLSILENVTRARTHEWIDQRSLALDQAVAAKLRAEPQLLEVAKANLARWAAQRGGQLPRALLEWKQILDTWSLEQILVELTSYAQEARRRRQSSPFCGILSPEERDAIFKRFESDLKADKASPNPIHNQCKSES